MEIRKLLRRQVRKYKEMKKKGTDELKKEGKRLGGEITKADATLVLAICQWPAWSRRPRRKLQASSEDILDIH